MILCADWKNNRLCRGECSLNSLNLPLFVLLGTVDLHNLPLKKTALKGLELPLEVKSGFIGHLQLSIPLRRPKSEPWIVHIKKLYLVAGPLQHSEVIMLHTKQHVYQLLLSATSVASGKCTCPCSGSCYNVCETFVSSINFEHKQLLKVVEEKCWQWIPP